MQRGCGGRSEAARPRRVWALLRGGACRLACVALLGAVPVRAAPLVAPEAPEASLVRDGLEALHAGAGLEAARLFAAYADSFPADPLAPLLQLKVSWWAILAGDAGAQAQLETDFAEVCRRAEAILAGDPDDVRALYALGEAHCARGRLQGIRGEAWAAVRSHQRGTPLLERALALAPDIAEPQASLGVYHYYAARAPGFMRFLGKLLSVEADRERGLQELWCAATTPGLQQEEATFFLTEILASVEDDAVEALPLALRLHLRFPHSLPFALGLATVHLTLERPDLAVRVLEPLAAAEGAVAARFFVARTLCASGRVEPALAILQSFTPEELRTVQWLAGWHAYYLGLAMDQLGNAAAARVEFERACAAPEVADSQSNAKRELARHGSVLHRSVRIAEASLQWDGDLDACDKALRAALEGERRRDADPDSRRRAQLALGVLALRRQQPDVAAQILRPLVEEIEADEAWLVVRPRLRLLQALVWSGQEEAARTEAGRLVPALGHWGSNRQLELLVEACLQPQEETGEMAQMEPASSRTRRVLFRLHDTGFTRVVLQCLDATGATLVVPMAWHGRFWEAEVALEPGEHPYRFLLEGTQSLPDPEATLFEERSDGLWSRVRVPPLPGS